MARMRLLQVGLGLWGLDWATEVLPRVPEVELVGYVDPDPAALARIGAALGVPAARRFASLDEALARVPCEGVLASLPTAFHVPVAEAALRAGRHVIVEKPFAPTLAEAAGLVRLAEERGLTLMVSQNYRFYPAPIAVAAMVASGELGRVLAVNVDFRRNAPREGYRYWDIPDPLLADMSIHHFDLLRMVLAAEPIEASCRTWNAAGSPFRADPCGTATITFANGAVASYRGSWLSRGPGTPWGGEWAMDFEEGAAFWACRGEAGARLAEERLAVRPQGGATAARDLTMFEEHDRAGSVAAFARVVTGGAGAGPPWFSSGRDNLGSLALVDACRLSAARDGAAVRLDEVLPAGFGGVPA